MECFATPNQMVKEDGKQAVLEEKLPFKVIEFNKDAKRIIVSHSRVFEDEQKMAQREANAERKAEAKAAQKEAAAEAANPAQAVEKATLGDLGELAALKEKLSEN